jgi:predicted MPP superfamily phosphohydrolase
MGSGDLIRALVFLTAVGLVFGFAALILVRMFLERRGHLEAPKGRKTLWIRRIILGLAGFGVLCIAWGLWVEPNWLEVTHVVINAPRLKSERPIRIVHISDLHCEADPRLEKKLPAIIGGLDPDLIVFTGDAINCEEAIPVFNHLMGSLSRIAPTFAIRGNWERFFPRSSELYVGTGARELKGEVERFRAAGAELWLVGIPHELKHKMERLLAVPPPGVFVVLLYHTPDEIERASEAGADLYLAGHIHGGQVALPLFGALVTLSRHGKKYERGLYRVKDTWLYVSRGIGGEGGYVPRVRFCARPEVTLIELR